MIIHRFPRALFVIGTLIFLTTLSPNSAFAAKYLKTSQFYKKLRFGSEMTISSQELLDSYPKNGNVVLVETPLANQKVELIKNSLTAKYLGSNVTFTPHSYHSGWSREAFTINYPDGFNLTLFPDPGALELNSSPSSQYDIEKNLNRIQEDFYDEGKKVGLEPALFAGSGHIHIEVTKLHPVTVRNFIADFFNATGLAAGALNDDIYNSIGVGEIPDANKQHLRNSFKTFDEQPSPTHQDLAALVSLAYFIKYDNDLEEYRKARDSKRPSKYFALSLWSLSSKGTIEIRSIRPQTSAKSYLKLVKLFTARMEHAQQKRIRGERVEIGALPSLRGNPQAVLADFDKYVTEAGLDFADYREFVLPWWQFEGGEFDQYMDSRFNALRRCETAFAP